MICVDTNCVIFLIENNPVWGPKIAARLATARAEVSAVEEYDYVVINDELERCVAELCAIVTAERARRARRVGEIAPIVRTFTDAVPEKS